MYANFDFDYQPTTEDLQDWAAHLAALEAEDGPDYFDPEDEEDYQDEWGDSEDEDSEYEPLDSDPKEYERIRKLYSGIRS